MYRFIKKRGCIVYIVHDENGDIDDEKIKEIKEIIDSKPIEQDGYVYVLKDDLTWELKEIPCVFEGVDI